MPDESEPRTFAPSPSNRLGLDYRKEASGFRRLGYGIIDAHTHVNGPRAAAIWLEVAELYGITETYTQTQYKEAAAVRDVLGDRARFIAIPDYASEDRVHAFTTGFLDSMRVWRDEFGAKMVKFWMAPRLRDYAVGSELEGLSSFDSPLRREQLKVAADLGYTFMTHTGDPDTWFGTKYADASKYGTKAEQYEPLERAIADFSPTPWLLAHMGGWPEDLDFLDGLLERHPEVVLDTSATKWQVRELSRHDSARFIAFLERWKGRVLFGSDVVTMDGHLKETPPPVDGSPSFDQGASDSAAAFDLYASRYWALRTMLETDYDGESPIADPDLEMVDPEHHDAMSAPRLRGHGLSDELLRVLYRDAAEGSLGKWYLGG